MPSPSPTSTFEEPGQPARVGDAMSATITVASYNMRKAIGTDRRRRPDRVLQVLQEIDADVVALQEADKRVGGRGAAVPHEVMDVAALDLPTLEPRGAVMAELLIADKPLRVIGMHLDLSGLWRRRQMRAILHAIAARVQKMPTVLMGDTNDWRDVNGCLKEIGSNYQVAPTGPSFHSRRPIACLDRIIVHTDLKIEAAGVHMSAASKRASDHLPVWAR